MGERSYCRIYNQSVELVLKPYALQLRTPFGTSHSSTTQRQNALIEVSIDGLRGYGECGLPPKKPLVYLSDFNDVESYFKCFVAHLSKIVESNSEEIYDPFKMLSPNYFKHLRESSEDVRVKIIKLLFFGLDTCPANDKTSRSSRNGIETALLDLWGKIEKKAIYQLIDIPPKYSPCFYTVSLNDDMNVMLEAAVFGIEYTPYLKIKLNQNLERCQEIVQMILNFLQNTKQLKNFKLSIDANSDWTPEIAIKFLEIVKSNKEFIYMVEQPFPVTIPEKDLESWKNVKQKYEAEGILVYADESIATKDDVQYLKDIVHGINIKLDKTGGIREALLAIEQATLVNLKIWIGIMVCSSLGNTAASHLLPLSSFGGDLDGSLLVSKESDLFNTTLLWDTTTGQVQPSDQPGVGVVLK